MLVKIDVDMPAFEDFFDKFDYFMLSIKEFYDCYKSEKGCPLRNLTAKPANPQGAGGLRSLRSVANPQEGVRSVPSVPSVRRKERMPSYLLQAITKKKPAHPKYSNLRY